MGKLYSSGPHGNREGLTGTMKRGGKRSSREAAKANPLCGGFIVFLKLKLWKTLPGLYYKPVEIEQGLLKPNY